MLRLIVSCLLLSGQCFLAGSCLASGASQVTDSTITTDAFTEVYVRQLGRQSLPRLLVYSPRGGCLGTLDVSFVGEYTARLGEGIGTLLEAPASDCGLFVDGDLQVGPEPSGAAPGAVVAQLLVFDGGFCEACTSVEPAFRSLADSHSGYRLLITRVSLAPVGGPGSGQ